MKKTMTRTLSLVLTICLIAGLLVVPAAAVESAAPVFAAQGDVFTMGEGETSVASVTFTLSDEPAEGTTFALYDAASDGAALKSGVAATGTALTFDGLDPAIAAGTYYVSATETDNDESARTVVRVQAATEPDPGPATYTITSAIATNGSFTVTVGGAVTAEVAEGETVTVTATADEGYELDAITVAKREDTTTTVTVGEDGTFTMPAYDVTVTVTFQETQVTPPTPADKYAITVAATENGTVTTSPADEAEADAEVTITAEPAQGYEVDTITVTDDESGNVAVNNGVFTMPAKAVTVTVTFKEEQSTPAETKTITFTVPEGVRVSPKDTSGNDLPMAEGKVTVDKNLAVTFLLDVEPGYQVDSVTGADSSSSGVYTVTADAVVITASKVKYAITVAATENGTVTTSPATEAEVGTEVTVTAAPAAGYELDTITVKDGDDNAVTVNDGKFTMPAKAVTITVTFTAARYTVTVNGGTADKAAAAAGEIVTLTPGAQAGKYFTGWTSSDVTISDNSFTMPAKNVTVTGSFAANPTVVPANLGQIDDGSALPANGLASNYKAVVKSVNGATKEVTVEVTADEVTLHNNAQGVESAWLGLGMPVESAGAYTYKKVADGAETEIATIKNRTQVVDGKTYETYYVGLGEAASTAEATQTRTLKQYKTADNSLVWTWQITFKAGKINAAGTTVVDKGALADAIAAANTTKEGVKTSDDGADVPAAEQWVTADQLATLVAAITTAQGVLDDASATQAQVDEAATALNAAVETFNGQKQDGKKPGEPAGPAVKDASIVFITAENYETLAPTYNYYGATAETLRPAADVQLPWLLVKYDRAQAGVVTFAVKKDNAAVRFGSGDDRADTLSFEAAGPNANAWISFHMVSQAGTDHKDQTWLDQADAAGAYEVTVTLGDDTATAKATYTAPEADKTALVAAIKTAQAKLDMAKTAQSGTEVLKTDLWATAAEKTALTRAIADAQAVADNKAATEAQVADAVAALAAAVEANLHAGEKDVTLDDLTAAVAAAKKAADEITVAEDAASVKRGEAFVTAAVKADYAAAITKAETVADNAEATAEEIEAALAELNEATLAFNAAKQEGTKSSRPSGGGGGGSSSSGTTGTTTTKDETLADGTKRTTVTAKDGTVTVTDTKPDGTKIVTTTTPAGEITTDVTLGKSAQSTQVRVGVDKANSGMVAVIVKDDGSEEIIRDSIVVDGEVIFDLDESATVKIVNRARSFYDMSGHWGKSAVDFVSARDLFNGVSDTHFAPDATMTRGMMATVLYRLDGEVKAGKRVDFSDVASGDWFAAAVDWASETGVINGYTDGTFGPNRAITREELVVMIYRYAGSPALVTTTGMEKFSDADQVSAWAEVAMRWAIQNGIINGKSADNIVPRGDATRAEVAAVLQRYVRLGK